MAPSSYSIHLDELRAQLARLPRVGGDGHDCVEYAVPVRTNGALAHDFACCTCGRYLQAG